MGRKKIIKEEGREGVTSSADRGSKVLVYCGCWF